jgi:ABC-2 type transport system permease protein
MRWRKVATVTRREYLSRVRTKAFWITTAAFPVLMIGMAVGPSLLASRAGGRYDVVLVTADTAVARGVAAQLERAGTTGDDNLVIRVRQVMPAADAAAQRSKLKMQVVRKEISGFAMLPPDIAKTGKFEYLSTNLSAFALLSNLERAVGRAVTRERLEGAGLPADSVDALTRPVDMQPVRIGKGGSENAESGAASFYLSFSFMMLLWISTMIYGFYVMRGVLEEKSSRIVEVIVANLSPLELMAGKIIGVGAVGLTQYAIWLVLAMNLAVPGLLGGVLGASGPLVSPALLGFFVLFFVLGYALYATAYAALGAAFNSEEEAHQMQSVAGWVMALPFMVMLPVLTNPDSTFSTVISMVPFFAPGLFFLRMTVQFPPVWQIALCLAILLATIFLVTRFAASVYRVGILMYGKRPTLREVLRWARTP